MRNCLFAGPFNELLIELSKDQLFTAIWEIPEHQDWTSSEEQASDELKQNRYYRRLLDCEIVLRFFAFRKPRLRGSVRAMLDRCMEDHLDSPEDKIRELGAQYRERLAVAYEIFGTSTFKHRDATGKLVHSRPLYDAVMVAIDRLWERRQRIVSKKRPIVKALNQLLAKKAAYEVIVGRPNTAKAIEKRIALLSRAMETASKG